MIGGRVLLLVEMELLIRVRLAIAVRAVEEFLAAELYQQININVLLFAE